MAASCEFTLPNGNPSILYARLEKKYGSDIAESIWYKIHTTEFPELPRDENGEFEYEAVIATVKPAEPVHIPIVQPRAVYGRDSMIAQFIVAGVEITTSPEASLAQSKKLVGKIIYALKLGVKVNDKIREALTEEVDQLRAADSLYMATSFPKGEIQAKLKVLGEAATRLKKPAYIYDTKNKTWFEYKNDTLTPTDVTNFIGNPYITGQEVIPAGELTPLIEQWKIKPGEAPTNANSIAAILSEVDTQTGEFPVVPDTISQKYYSVPVLDNSGNPTGENFSDEEFEDILDTLVQESAFKINESARKSRTGKPTVNMGTLISEIIEGPLTNTILGLKPRIEDKQTKSTLLNSTSPEQAKAISDRIQKVINSVQGNPKQGNMGILPFLSQRLNEMGFSVKGKVVEDTVQTAYSDNNLSDNTEGTVSGEEVRGIIDYSKSAININPIDSASMRVKMFLAGTPECAMREVPYKNITRMSITNPTLRRKALGLKEGEKMISIRTGEQVAEIGVSLDGSMPKEGVMDIDGIKFKVTAKEKWNPAKLTDGPTRSVLLDEGLLKTADKLDERAVIYEITPFISEFVPVPVRGSLMAFKAADFQKLFASILTELGGRKLSNKDMVAVLSQSDIANIRYVAKRLENSLNGVVIKGEMVTNNQLVNEFNKVMTQRYSTYNTLMFNTMGDKVGSYTVNSNNNSAAALLSRNWKEAFKESAMVSTMPSGELMVNRTVAEEFYNRMLAHNKDNAVERQQLVQDFASAIGIEIPNSAFNTKGGSLSDPKVFKKLTKGTGLSINTNNMFGFNKDGKPNGLFSTIIARLAGKHVDTFAEEESDVEKLLANNPFDTESRSINALAKVVLKHNPDIVVEAANHRSPEGKSVYNYTLYAYETRKFEDLQTPVYRSKLEQCAFNKGSRLSALFNDEKNFISLGEYEGNKDQGKPRADGKGRAEQSDIEQEFASIQLYQGSGSNYFKCMEFTKSDKTRTLLWEGIRRMDKPVLAIFNEVTGNYTLSYRGADAKLSKGPVEEFHSIFYSEFDRICEWYQKNEKYNQELLTNPQAVPPFNDDRFAKGGGLFYLLPHFNYDNMKKLEADGKITKEHVAAIWESKGKPALIITELRSKAINAVLRNTLGDMEAEIKKSWESKGITNAEKSTTLFNSEYIKKQIHRNLGITEVVKDGTTELLIAGKPFINKEQYHEMIVTYAIKDYLAHNLIMYADIARTISGDPAMCYKKPKGANLTDTDHVISTMIEYQKRLAKDIAPGKEGAFDPNETYRAVTFLDYESGYSKELADIIPAYKDGINATDAQEVTTVREHLYVMFKNGEIRDNVYKEMVAIINEGLASPSKYYEFTKPEHTAVVMQIMKPVYVGERFAEGQMYIDYIKSSSYALYPPYTKGKELEKLRLKMEGDVNKLDANGFPEGHINRGNFISAKKMGAPLQSVALFNEDGTINEVNMETQFPRATVTLERKNFRIQQDVPYDSEKEKILIPSQANKNIVAGLPDDVYFGTSGDKADVRRAKEAVRKLLIKSQFDELMADIENTSQLVERIKEMSIGGGYSLNEMIALTELNPDGMPKIPFALSPVLEPSEKLLMSMMTKATQVKMYGKSFVQASSAGITSMKKGIEGLEGDIIWAPGYTGGELQMTKTVDGEMIATAQILIPQHLIGQNFESMILQSGEEGYVAGKKILNTAKVDPKLLDMIGLRIPNQGHNSMLPMEIVGFLPANMGDMIVVPKGITTQMGSDFDVDKLYVFKRPYNYNEETGVFTAEEAVANLDSLESAVRGEMSFDNKNLLATYFRIYHDVLTSPAMTKSVLSPLDKPDLKDEIKGLPSPMNYMQFLSPQQQLLSFTSQKDAKKLVGTSSLFLTQMSQLEVANDVQLVTLVEGVGPTQTVIKLTIDGKKLEFKNLHGAGQATYNGETRTKFDNIATQQNAFLDHAKEPIADKLNITVITFPASAVLSMLSTDSGEAVNLTMNARLMRQEILVEYNSRMQRNTGAFGAIKKTKEDIINDLKIEWVNKGARNSNKELGPEILKEALDGKVTAQEKLDIELSSFELFIKLDKIAEKLQKAQRALNYDSKGVGANTMQAMDKEMAGEEVKAYKDDIKGLSQLFDGTEAGYIRNQANIALEALDPILNTETQRTLNERFQQLFGLERIDESTGRTIRNGYKSYILSQMSFTESAYQDRIRLLHGEDRIAKQLRAAKTTWGRNNYFVQRLSTTTMDEIGHPEYITYEAGVKNEYDNERIPALWSRMIVSENAKERKFGQDLLKYAMLLGGIQEANNFAKFIPSGYLIDSGLADEMGLKLQSANAYIESVGLQISVETFEDRFAYQWAQNNGHTLRQIETEEGEAIKEEYVYENVDHDMPESLKALRVLDPMKSPELVPVEIAAKYNREEKRYYIYKSQSREDGAVVFTRIDTLGSSFMYEYDANVDVLQSTVPNNRSSVRYAGNYMGMLAKLSTGNDVVDNTELPFNPISRGRGAGVTEGTYVNDEADKLLKQIVEMPSTPAPLQILGEALLPIMGYDRFFEGDQFQIDVMSPRGVTELFGFEVAGAFVAESNRLVLNSQAPTFAETFIHEALHSTSLRTVAKMFSDPTYAKAYPDLYRHVQELEQLRQGALRMFLEANPEYTDKMAEISKGKIDPNSDLDRVAYGLSNVNEIITHSLTNPTFQKWAAKQQYKDRSIISSMIDWVAGLITAIGKSIGIKVPEGTVLHQAIQYSLNISRLSDSAVVTVDNNGRLAQEPLDPKYELFPGVFANQEQRVAIDRLDNFFASDNKQFLLSGAGGTGKTTVIQKIARTLEGNVGYCAPTNAAKQTLAASGDIPPDASFTVAQLLNMEPDTRSEHLAGADPNSVVIDGMRFRVLTDAELIKKRKTRTIKRMDTVIIDESSMVDDELVALIHKHKNAHTKIVWMGDYAQLEPVGQSNEAWPFRNLTGDPSTSAVLVKNERSRAQDIVSVVNKYRRGVNSAVESKSFNMIPIPFVQRVNSSNIKYLKGQEAFQTMVKAFQENSGVRDVSVLATTNAMVDNVNLLVREALFGKDSAPFRKGERLVSNTNVSEELPDGGLVTILSNSEMALVTGRQDAREVNSVSAGIITVPIKVTEHPIAIKTEGGLDINVTGLSVEDWNKVDKYLRTMRYANGYATLGDGSSYRYGDVKEAQMAFASQYPLMKPGYAMTVHKAQGRSIKHTFVMEDNIINGAPKFSAKNKIKSLYTAVSRASEKLYIINPGNPDNAYKLDVASKVRDTEFGGLAGPYEFDNVEDARNKSAELTAKYPGLAVELYRDAINPILPKMELGNLPSVPALKSLGSDVAYNPISGTASETQLRIEKLADSLRKTQNQLLNARRETTDPQERAVLSTQIEEANLALAELEGNMDIGAMMDLADHQLKWVESLINGNIKATASTINYAVIVSNIWRNVTHSIYGDEAGQAGQRIIGIQGRAQNLQDRLMPLALDIFEKLSAGNINPEDLEFTSISDKPGKYKPMMSSVNLYIRDLSQVDSKFGQQMAKFLQDASAARNESVRRLQGTISEFDALYEKIAKDMGTTRAGVTQMLLQESGKAGQEQMHWGLVREYSRSYWDHVEKLRRQRDARLATLTDKSLAWKEYNKETNKISLLVDVNKLVDPTTKKMKYSADQLEQMFQNKEFGIPEVKYYAEIRRETPGAFMAKKLILRAENYLLKYEAKLEDMKFGLNGRVADGTMKQSEANDALNNWVATNSPYYYLEYLTGYRASTDAASPQGYKYLQRAPRMSYDNGSLYDSKYWDIFKNFDEKNPTDLQKLHMMTSEMMKEFKALLPDYITKNMGSNFLPGIKAAMMEEIKLDKTLLKTLPAKLIEMLTAEEDSAGDNNMVPVRYTGKLEAKDAGQDLALSLLKFGTMAYHYSNMSETKDIVEIGQHMINKAILNSKMEANNQSTARGVAELENLKKSIDYTTNVLMYQKSRYLEGETSKKLYTLNPLKGMRITNALRELNGRQLEVDKDFEDGKIGKDQYNALSLQIATDKQMMYEANGIVDTNRKVYGSRIADFLIRYQALKSLSYNPISAFSNMSFGMISLFIHGAGQQDFTNKNATQAIGLMMDSSKRAGSFGAWDSPMARKIAALVERLNIMGDIAGIDYHDNVADSIKGRKKGWGKRLGPYEIMKSSDFFAKGSIAVSMALAHQVDVVEDGVAKKISLFAALDENGEWNEAKYGPNPDWFSENPADEKEFNKFRSRAVKVTKKIMGNQDPNSPIYGKKFTLVRLVGQFRMSWLAEGFMSRFESERPDIDLGRTAKGRYRTYADLGLAGSLSTLGRMIMANFTGADPFTNRLADGRKLGTSDTDIANMKMNLMELQFGLALAAAIAFVGFLLDGDDDEEHKWLQVTYNLLFKNLQDTMFYMDPDTTMDILRMPIPAMSVITDIQKAIGVTMNEMTGDDPADISRIILKWTKAGVPIPQTALINKIDYIVNQNLSDISKSR